MDGQAHTLIELAISRHGGQRGSRIRSIELPAISLRGWLPRLKGHGRTFRTPRLVHIEPLRARAVFVDYPNPGESGLFDGGRVALGESQPFERRATFSGIRMWRQWSALDALYFFGYALTHYHALPWSLRDAEPLALRRTRQSGATHALTVRFPGTVHTHSEVQTLYFGRDGLIVRHDYVADIVGPWARAAHLWLDFVEVNGIPVATRRRVLARVGRQPLPILALEARFGPPEVTLD
jgi:hypothetical protein